MAYQIDCSKEVVLITGGARGIGSGITEIYVKAGAQTVICGMADETRVAPFLDKMETLGKRPHYIQCDVAQEDSVRAMMDDAALKFGGIDVLVCNAGISGQAGGWDECFAVNTKGVWYCCDAARPYLKEREGRIVIISSGSILYGGKHTPQYVSTKAAAAGLVRFLAREYAPDRIRVNGILPCVIITDMLAAKYESEEAMLAHYAPQMPLGKVGYPKDIAGVTLFLSSELSDFVDGQILMVDGGRMHIG